MTITYTQPNHDLAKTLPELRPTLRVLLVTARYLPSIGGTEMHTYELARRLSAAGNEVTVLTTDPNGEMPKSEQFENIRVIRVRASPANSDLFFAPAIYSTIRQGNWDIIHCQGCHTLVAPLAMLAAKHSNIPYVVTFHSGGHSSRVRTALRGVQWSMLKPLLAGAERLIGVSAFEANFFQKQLRLPHERFTVISNGSYFPSLANLPTTNNPEALIVSVGRLERYKGHHRVIAALPYIIRHWPNVRLRIIGAGPYEQTLQRMARNVGVADRVQIGAIDPYDREGMAGALLKASLMILLSDYESQGIAVLEALSLGLPVLVADTSGLHELAAGGLVKAIPPKSHAEQISASILEHLRQPSAPQSIRLPSWDNCTSKILALYYDILEGRH